MLHLSFSILERYFHKIKKRCCKQRKDWCYQCWKTVKGWWINRRTRETSYHSEREALRVGWGMGVLCSELSVTWFPQKNRQSTLYVKSLTLKSWVCLMKTLFSLSQTHQKSGPTSLWPLRSCSYVQSLGTIPTGYLSSIWTHKSSSDSNPSTHWGNLLNSRRILQSLHMPSLLSLLWGSGSPLTHDQYLLVGIFPVFGLLGAPGFSDPPSTPNSRLLQPFFPSLSSLCLCTSGNKIIVPTSTHQPLYKHRWPWVPQAAIS